jgi:hypothetical protein
MKNDSAALNHGWGAAAAIACGLGIRFADPILAATGFAGAVAIAGACFIALLDAMSS